MGSDKAFAEAHHALIDPLNEPDPSDETGLNSHFGSTFAPRQTPTPPTSAGHKQQSSVNIRPQNTGSSVDTNPYRRMRNSQGSVSSKTYTHPRSSQHGYPSPPNSASPRRDHFSSSHRAEAFGSLNEGRPRRSSQPTPYNPSKNDDSVNRKGLARGGSLRERYPGDKSVRPLDTLRKEEKTAYRAHHLRKKNHHGTDVIDRLDRSGFAYHHDGPYDAANIARNKNYTHSPIAAVADSNEEALRATPRENIIDAVTKHRPLEGVANIPPGIPDRFGRVLDYEEGADLQREPGGDYRRWPGQKYLPEDLKGKGEPSYSVDRALKDHKKYGDSGVEMSNTRRRNRSLDHADPPDVFLSPFNDSAGIGRSNTTGKSVGNALKKRFGSLRRRKQTSEVEA